MYVNRFLDKINTCLIETYLLLVPLWKMLAEEIIEVKRRRRSILSPQLFFQYYPTILLSTLHTFLIPVQFNVHILTIYLEYQLRD